MELRQLRYFTAVVNLGSFSRAAEHLHVAQSAISRQVQRLEEEMGVSLILRGKPQLQATEAGLLLLERATDIIDQVRSLREHLQEQAEIPKGKLRIGFLPFSGQIFMPQAIRNYRKNFPQVGIHVRTAMSGTLLEWLRTDLIDIAAMHSPWTGSDFVCEPLVYSKMVVVLPAAGVTASLGIKDQAAYSLQELGALPLILPSAVNPQRALVDREAIALGLRLDVVMEAEDLGTILSLVREGIGCTIIAYGAVHRFLEYGGIRVASLASPGIITDISLVTNGKRPATAALRAFKSHVRSAIATVAGSGEIPPDYFRLAPFSATLPERAAR